MDICLRKINKNGKLVDTFLTHNTNPTNEYKHYFDTLNNFKQFVVHDDKIYGILIIFEHKK